MKYRKHIRELQAATVGRPFFPIDWDYFWFITRAVFVTGDTVKIRMLMALSSIAWVVLLLAEPTMFQRHGYELIRVIPKWIWVTAFAIHGFGGVWRIYERADRVRVSAFINYTGLAVWAATTIGINWAIGTVVAGTALEAIGVVFLFFATYRTGRNREGISE